MHLPEDLLVEILSRVPAVALARLRSTSKRWNALFKDGRFAKKHFANAPRHSSLIVGLIEFRVYLVSINLHGINNNNVDPSAKLTGPFSLKDPLFNYSQEVYIRNAFHYDGLLLCITKDYRLVVWNPCLGETKWIQPIDSYKESDYYALGYDNKSSCYKILRMQRFADDKWHTVSEVYDFASNSRRSVGVTTDWIILGSQSRGMYVKGTTYWLAFSKDISLYDRCFLLSFDFSRDRFQSLPLPTDAKYPLYVALSMTKEEQQFCMYASPGCEEVSKSDVWIATKTESTGAMSWTKFRRFHTKIGLSVSADHEKKVLVLSNSIFCS